MSYDHLLESLPVQRIKPVVFIPFWKRTMLDVSGDENDISSIQSPLRWARCGEVDCIDGNQGWLQISPDSSLVGITKMSFFIAINGISHVGNEYIIRTLTGFPWFYTYGPSPTGFFLYDGTNFSAGVANIVGATSCGFSIDTGPAKPRLYVNGIVSSVGSVDLTINTISSTWRIAATNAPNYLRSPFYSVLLYDDVLTDEEWASLNSCHSKRISPRVSPNHQYWDRGSWIPIQSPIDVAAWDFGIVTLGESADRSGNEHHATHNGIGLQHSELGQAARHVVPGDRQGYPEYGCRVADLP
jgi:hypothetical protein